MLNLLRKNAVHHRDGRRLYDALVSRSRAPVFFADFAVADTMDGRFDMLALHAWLVLTELAASGARKTAQALTDILFTGFDEALREQGAGDMSIAHRLKAMADGFYGRLAAYEGAATEEELAAALARNLWRGGAVDRRARILAAYALAVRVRLKQSLPASLDFGPLPSLSGATI